MVDPIYFIHIHPKFSFSLFQSITVFSLQICINYDLTVIGVVDRVSRLNLLTGRHVFGGPFSSIYTRHSANITSIDGLFGVLRHRTASRGLLVVAVLRGHFVSMYFLL